MKKRRRLLSQSERGEGDAFHFVSYVPYKGKIYELDGLREVRWLLAKRQAK